MATEASSDEGSASRFPFIPLSKALERAGALRKSAGDHAAPITEIPAIWGYAAKASGWRQTIAALKYYGLIADSGSKDRREIRLTEDARRYFLDERPEVHNELNRKFALAPRSFETLWKEWKAAPPADNIARSQLKIKFGYAENAAPQILSVYKANLDFAKLTDRDDDSPIAEGSRTVETPGPTKPPPNLVRVGDYVQWTSNGQEQFPKPQRVNWVSDDGTHVRVHGSMTGIATDELTVVDQPKPPSLGPMAVAAVESNRSPENKDINVLLTGKRLQITADVDQDGLTTLKQMLDKYEEILKLLG